MIKRQTEAIREELFKLFVLLFEYSSDRYGSLTGARVLLDSLLSGELDIDRMIEDAEEFVRLQSTERDLLEDEFTDYIQETYEASSKEERVFALLDRLNGNIQPTDPSSTAQTALDLSSLDLPTKILQK